MELEELKEMPDLTTPTHGFHHTADTALQNLMNLGVGADRITLKKAGRGWGPLRVVDQRPATGAPLPLNAPIELFVEGDGSFDHLPIGMRHGSREGDIGSREFIALFDDAVDKAAVYVRLGGLFFDVRPGNPEGCARWIRLFGVDPDAWPRERLYRLAVLLPCLRNLSGLETGLRLAMRLLLGLEIHSIEWRPRRTTMAREDRSLLGRRAGRLGVDLILGDGVADEAALQITFGPVSLVDFRRHRTRDGEQRIEQVMRLVSPYHWVYDLKWLVGDAARGPRLGVELQNAVLGVNSHLGRK